MTALTFGKHKNEMLEMTPESYIKWLATHKAVLSPEHRTVSDAAKGLLEKKENVMSKEYDISYEEYQEQELLSVTATWLDESDLKELEEQYPEYAARAKAEADARRGCTWEEYQAQLKTMRQPEQSATFVLEKSYNVGDVVWSEEHQYRVVEQSSFMSEKEAAELEDIAPGINSGWYTKVELVA